MTQEKSLILQGAQVLTQRGLVADGRVTVAAGKIQHIGQKIPKAKLDKNAQVVTLPKDSYLLPGFIDLHVHGAAGNDVMDGDNVALETMSKALAREGITAFVATTVTESANSIERAINNVRDYKYKMARAGHQIGAAILGVNLEGPFLAHEKMGAQNPQYLVKPQITLLEKWLKLAPGLIKIMTVAPELPGAIGLIKFLKQHKIIAALGHSDATFAEATKAITAGANHATHLFNAMRQIHQREPGLAMAALLDNKVSVELIVDNVHLHPAMVELVLQLKDPKQIILVTDAMCGKAMPDGNYKLGGQKVMVKNGAARLASGALAGSVLTMGRAVRNMLQIIGRDRSRPVPTAIFHQIINMASFNPAHKLHIADHKGSIAVGKDADLVALNKKLEVIMTICGGEVVWGWECT